MSNPNDYFCVLLRLSGSEGGLGQATLQSTIIFWNLNQWRQSDNSPTKRKLTKIGRLGDHIFVERGFYPCSNMLMILEGITNAVSHPLIL